MTLVHILLDALMISQSCFVPLIESVLDRIVGPFFLLRIYVPRQRLFKVVARRGVAKTLFTNPPPRCVLRCRALRLVLLRILT